MKSLKKVFLCLLVVLGICSVLKTDVSAYEKKQDYICQTGWSDTSITVEWPNFNEDYFKVFVLDENNGWKYVDTVTNPCYTFNNLEPGTVISVGVLSFPRGCPELSDEEYLKDNMGYILHHAKTTISNISGDITYKWYEKGKVLKYLFPDYGKNVEYLWKTYSIDDDDEPEEYCSNKPTAFMGFWGGLYADGLYKCSLELVTSIPDPNSMYGYVEIHSNKIWYTHVMQSSPKKCVVAKNKKSFKLTWHKLKGATGYEVWCSTKPRSGYKKVKTLGKNTTSYTVKKVKGKRVNTKRTYYYYIKTKCGNKISDVYYAWSTKKGTKKPAIYLGD
ncbi:MAG: hypothetical protein V8S28_01310 [Lachnospiraceae bacterium]